MKQPKDNEEAKKVIRVHSKMICPVRKKDGTWTTVIKEFDEEIPNLGRHIFICNKCGMKNYPDCIPDCPIEKAWRDYKPNIVD